MEISLNIRNIQLYRESKDLGFIPGTSTPAFSRVKKKIFLFFFHTEIFFFCSKKKKKEGAVKVAMNLENLAEVSEEMKNFSKAVEYRTLELELATRLYKEADHPKVKKNILIKKKFFSDFFFFFCRFNFCKRKWKN